MKSIQNNWATLMFIGGFAIFISSFFLGSFRLNKSIISNVLEHDELELLEPHLDHVLDVEYDWGFAFVKDLDRALTAANDQVFKHYAISDGDLSIISSKVAENDPLQFNLELVEKLYASDNEVAQMKQKAFQDYGSWLDGRVYQDITDLNRDLQSVANNFNNYGLINQMGFDRYRVKNLKFELAKAANTGPIKENPWLFLFGTYALSILGAILYFLPKVKTEGPPGIKNHGIQFSSMKNRGWLGILTGTFLIVFYVLLYFYPEYMTNWIVMVDPISLALNGGEAGRFFLYGFIYTLCILVMGVRMLINYRHSNYQIMRTISVMFFQTAFAFLIPEILVRLNKPYFDFKNIWPLDYDFFFDNEINTLIDSGTLGIFMLGWGTALIVLAVPIMVYFFGKRWYCSWVCGCGGLAETLGDPYRQLSDKSLKAWKIERWMVHGVLVFAVLMTAGVLYTYWTGSSQLLGLNTYSVRSVYGAWIGAGFAGVVGTGVLSIDG